MQKEVTRTKTLWSFQGEKGWRGKKKGEQAVSCLPQPWLQGYLGQFGAIGGENANLKIFAGFWIQSLSILLTHGVVGDTSKGRILKERLFSSTLSHLTSIFIQNAE